MKLKELKEKLDFYKSVIIELEKRVYNAEMERDQLKNWLARIEKISIKQNEQGWKKFCHDLGIGYKED